MDKEHDLSLEVDHIKVYQVSRKDKGGCGVSGVERLERIKEIWQEQQTKLNLMEQAIEEDQEVKQRLNDLLEEQQKEIERLKDYCSKSANFINQVELEEENARLREVLKYYINPERSIDSMILDDKGHAARQALKE